LAIISDLSNATARMMIMLASDSSGFILANSGIMPVNVQSTAYLAYSNCIRTCSSINVGGPVTGQVYASFGPFSFPFPQGVSYVVGDSWLVFWAHSVHSWSCYSSGGFFFFSAFFCSWSDRLLGRPAYLSEPSSWSTCVPLKGLKHYEC
jgi:hypothetical protein